MALQIPNAGIPYYSSLPLEVRAIGLLDCLIVYFLSNNLVNENNYSNDTYYYAEVCACIHNNNLFLYKNINNVVVTGEKCDLFLSLNDNNIENIINNFIENNENNCYLGNQGQIEDVPEENDNCYCLHICWQ